MRCLRASAIGILLNNYDGLAGNLFENLLGKNLSDKSPRASVTRGMKSAPAPLYYIINTALLYTVLHVYMYKIVIEMLS